MVKIFSVIKSLIFPQKCASCLDITDSGAVFCEKCMPEIPFVDGVTCEKCGISLSAEFPSPVCGRCREREFKFDKNIPLMEYSGLGRETVINMKYKSAPVINDMALLLAGRIKEFGIDFDIVTFVPMLKKDEAKKGISVTYFLSKKIAKLLLKEHKELIIKVKETKKQKELTAKERIINVRGAYGIKGDVDGKSILLIDDVFTTGATMDECSKILKKAGAEKVYCATVGIRDRE